MRERPRSSSMISIVRWLLTSPQTADLGDCHVRCHLFVLFDSALGFITCGPRMTHPPDHPTIDSSSMGAKAGKLKPTENPPPGLLRAQIVPSCASTSLRQTVSPSPCPGAFADVFSDLKKLSNILSTSSGATPSPASVTST